MSNPMANGVTEIFYIGRPDLEEPHRSMDRCQKFHEKHPDKKLVVFLWDQKDVDEFSAKKDPRCDVVLWQDDSATMNWLLNHIASIVGVRILWNRHWICRNQHITGYDYNADYTTLTPKCETCGEAVTIAWPDKLTRVDPFCELFKNVLQLSNFDTTSGEYLNRLVCPTKNVLMNMRYALGCAHEEPINLKGKEAGRPALLCAAGPSLDKAIPELLRLQYGSVISCVGRSYKKLKAAGVRIDYTISVEMFDWDSAMFDGLSAADVGDTVLAYASVCAPATVEKWPGKRYCLWDTETAKLLGRDDAIFGGNSVAHHQLNFAIQILGCDPLILVGNDLAYTEPKTHAEGVIPEKWPEEIKHQDVNYHSQELWVPCTAQGNDFHPQCHRTPVVMAPGSFLPSRMIEVRSSYPYKHFATLFSILIAKHGKKVWNACPNGQKLPGTEYIDLASWNP